MVTLSRPGSQRETLLDFHFGAENVEGPLKNSLMYLAEKNGDKKRSAGWVGGWREEEREPGGEGEHRGGRGGGVYMLVYYDL